MRSFFLLSFSLVLFAACSNDANVPGACEEGDLVFLDEQIGDGAEATRQSVVRVNYAGRLVDGEEFDSGQNAQLDLAQMIPGFREGIAGMRVGGARQLTIPPLMGYGPDGRPPIPPCATLVFDVELVEIVR